MRGNRFDMNRSAVFEDTSGVPASLPLQFGSYCQTEESDRLRSTYSLLHNRKMGFHDRRTDIMSKPSSRRLLAGTNEYAEDLTGQKLPLNASAWKSETQSSYKGTLFRPTSAPMRQLISVMENQEPVFAKTSRHSFHSRCQDIYPSKPTVGNQSFEEREMYQTSYSATHRPFVPSELRNAPSINPFPQKLPWLQDPSTQLRLQCRVPSQQPEQKWQPTEAQMATLPHYTDPQIKFSNSENRVAFQDPYKSEQFYHEAPNKLQKPIAQHLQRSFIN